MSGAIVRENHIALVETVNRAKTEQEHQLAQATLNGWRRGLEACGHRPDLMGCDMYYLHQGIDRPMCCGVFLDWAPTEERASDE